MMLFAFFRLALKPQPSDILDRVSDKREQEKRAAMPTVNTNHGAQPNEKPVGCPVCAAVIVPIFVFRSRTWIVALLGRLLLVAIRVEKAGLLRP